MMFETIEGREVSVAIYYDFKSKEGDKDKAKKIPIEEIYKNFNKVKFRGYKHLQKR
jgi:hypothetical protein